VDKTEVQTLALRCQLVEDDGIYKLYQICSAPFSNNRSNLSHPVETKTGYSIVLHSRFHDILILDCVCMGSRRREVKPVVMDIHKYLVELGLRIHLHLLDGEICRTQQIYMSQFSNNTAH
jgi:hypothetical protein